MVKTWRRGTETILWGVDAVELRYGVVVNQVLAYVWCFDEERNIVFLEFIGGANPREHEELRGAEHAATDDYFFVGFENLACG